MININVPGVSIGVLVLFIVMCGAKSSEISLNGSTVVDIPLKVSDGRDEREREKICKILKQMT